ncbi:MAG: CPBP family intramembrane glutamic endopeptidase [Xanthobacteraceae bacterium]
MSATGRPGQHQSLRFGLNPVPLWYIAAIAAMMTMEMARLAQTASASWIACDYAGRIGALALLAAIPAARAVAFPRERSGIGLLETVMWITGLFAFDHIVNHALAHWVSLAFPHTRIAWTPHAGGWLYVFDTSFGLILVAYSEEVIFRRCSRAVLRDSLGDGPAMIIATSILFAAYHWWTGVGNILATMSYGVLAMLFYRRSGSLVPVVVNHYLCDVVNFS